MKTPSVGIIGCGNISNIYAEAGKAFENLSIVACADLDVPRAEALAAEYGITKALSVDALLDDPEISLVINLTVPAVHAEVAQQILAKGKHVYNEKPLALRRRDAREMMALARKSDLRIGCAPDTFLGGGLQTCRKLIDEGAIGTPIGGVGFMLSRGVEGWHPNPEFFYKKGGGPLFDILFDSIDDPIGAGGAGDRLGPDEFPATGDHQPALGGPNHRGRSAHPCLGSFGFLFRAVRDFNYEF
jgi:predicted dehydrogenase